MNEKRKGFFIKTILASLLMLMVFEKDVYGASVGISTDSATAIPSGYHFAPRYISSSTQVALCQAPSGFKWVAVSGTGYYQLQTTSGAKKMPENSYKGKIYVTYKNVGTYFDRTIDMKITLIDWNSRAKRIEFGRTYLGFGNPSGDDGGTSAYISAKIEYFYSGTTTLVENMKGHQPIGDMDYWSNNNTCEWIKPGAHATMKYIFDQDDYDKFDLSKMSSDMVGVKKGYGGTSNSDGASFVYLFDSASHNVTWYGGFLRLNLTCPIKEFEVWYMANGGQGQLYSKVYKYGVNDLWLENRYTKKGYHPKGGDSQANWHVYRDYDDKWASRQSDTNWQSNKPSSEEEFRHFVSHGTVSKTVSCGNVYSYVCWEPNTYTVKYNGNGAKGMTEDSHHVYDSKSPLSPNGFVKEGYTFMGWSTSKDGSLMYKDQQTVLNMTDQHEKTIELYALWKENGYVNTIDHVALNNENQKIVTLGQSDFNQVYHDSFTIDKKLSYRVPTGFYLDSQFDYVNEDTTYQMPKLITQINKSLKFIFYYKPQTYKISYELHGGINHPSNPLTYTIVDVVSLEVPYKEGCEFLGWYIGSQKVTSINSQKITSVSSADELYQLCENRVSGDITLTAKWSTSKPTIETKVAYYFKDETISQSEVKKSASAYDEYDGNISEHIVIKSFHYPDGRIEENPSLLDTSKVGIVEVLYSVTNSHGQSTDKIGYVYIVEKGSQTIDQFSSAKIYTRFIRLEECMEGTLPLETLFEDSIWNQEAYYNVLLSSLHKSGNDYLADYDYINDRSYVALIRER